MSYHPGEIEAQERAGVRDLAERVGRIIRPTIAAPAVDFLEAQTMVLAATRRTDGTVHASALTGPPGFARAAAATSIEIRPDGGHIETVSADLTESDAFALLAIEFATRRRMRANGRASLRGGAITLETEAVYSNCPQRITRRSDRIEITTARADTSIIEPATTFFIATAHPEAGADVSHRGGPPGFVRLEGDRLSWPDYDGNNMFNTVGNLLVNPRCGLLFIDFESGASLQIEGTASVLWQPERRIEVAITDVSSSASRP